MILINQSILLLNLDKLGIHLYRDYAEIMSKIILHNINLSGITENSLVNSITTEVVYYYTTFIQNWLQ